MQTIVTTRQGAVEGIHSTDGKTVIFRGVPYAKAPVGALRFQRPQPRDPWEGVLDCKAFSPICPQADLRGMPLYGKEFYDGEEVVMNEDCLYLNIWTPEDATADSRLPVLVWIHGGAFMHGHGSEKEFDGEGFAKKGVILVTVNYRVNVFGFFAHPELESETEEILGVKLPKVTIPVSPGRNLAVILETAAMNNRQKKMGYNAAMEFTEQINKHFDSTMAME